MYSRKPFHGLKIADIGSGGGLLSEVCFQAYKNVKTAS